MGGLCLFVFVFVFVCVCDGGCVFFLGRYDIGKALQRADAGTSGLHIPEENILCCDAEPHRHDATCPRFVEDIPHLVEKGNQLVPAKMNFRIVCCDQARCLYHTSHADDCPLLQKNRPAHVDSETEDSDAESLSF